MYPIAVRYVRWLLATWYVAVPADGSVPQPPDQFGRSVLLVPDVNQDGRAELVIGDPSYAAGNSSVASGAVWLVLSGSTDAAWRCDGKVLGQNLGSALTLLWDVDGDGASDIAASGVPQHDALSPLAELNETLVGVVYVISTRSGKILRELHGDQPGDRFGFSLCLTGDMNSDGFLDVAIGAPGLDAWRPHRQSIESKTGSIRLVSGKDLSSATKIASPESGIRFGYALTFLESAEGVRGGGARVPSLLISAADDKSTVGSRLLISHDMKTAKLLAHGPSEQGACFGSSLLRLADANSDGYEDYLVCARSRGGGRRTNRDNGFVQALSGVDGKLIWEALGTRSNSRFAMSVRGATALVEGKAESVVLIGDYEPNNLGVRGRVQFHSLRDGNALFSLEGGYCFGVALDSGLDWDGDKVADIVIASCSPESPRGNGVVQVYSGATRQVAFETRRYP